MIKRLQKQRQLCQINPLVQSAILVLKDSKDFSIVSLLINNGATAFSVLKKHLEINQTELDRRLNRLMNGALVNNFYAKHEGRRVHSFYEATELAETIFEKLEDVQKPSSPIPLDRNPFYLPGPDIELLHGNLRNALDTLERLKRLSMREVEK
jgi:DNA-binding HxlR family transcriptional regulator